VPVRGADGEWTVAKIDLPPPPAPTGTASREETRPPADDPREKPWLNPPSGGIT
jgi:hypothetical protein